jgi:SAM-dependent methyltransferase
MARGVLMALSEMTGEHVRSFAAGLPPVTRRLDILDTQIPFSWPPHAGYQLPSVLAGLAGLRVETSQFKPTMPWGARLGPSTTNQNLECLTFADTSFDIVLASDVMEHVRLYTRAHSEIRRILRPGGYYIFTVPHTRAMDEHVVRVAVHAEDDPAQDEHLLRPEYHGSADPDEQAGVLSYRCFGRNLDRELIALGFDVLYLDAPEPSIGIFTSEVFICRRL